MANTGRKVNNTYIIEGVSWDDRYNITGSQRDEFTNVVRLGGVDVTGSFTERALVWHWHPNLGAFPSASLGVQFPSGTLVIDVAKKSLILKTDNANTWIHFSGSSTPVV